MKYSGVSAKMQYITVFFTSRGKMNITNVERIVEDVDTYNIYKDNDDTKIVIPKNKIDMIKFEKLVEITELQEINKMGDNNAKKVNDRSRPRVRG
jgi:hypothetical protein